MPSSWSHVSRKTLMESVTLQLVLEEIVEDQKENVLPEDRKSWRQLPIELESTVADLLAFLSATHDDNLNIMAVCIEEACDHTHTTIRIASNSGECASAKNGLDEMARILEKAHSQGIVSTAWYLLLIEAFP
jgi:hypothetical protein